MNLDPRKLRTGNVFIAKGTLHNLDEKGSIGDSQTYENVPCLILNDSFVCGIYEDYFCWLVLTPFGIMLKFFIKELQFPEENYLEYFEKML